MSTDNLKGIDALRRSIHTSAEGVRQRAREVADEADLLEAQQERDDRDAEIVRRLLRRRTQDELNALDEEGGQLAEILTGSAPAAPAAPAADTPPAAPAPDPALAPAPAPQAADPAGQPTRQLHPVAPAPAPATVQHSVIDVRHWTPVQLVCAIIGLLVALVILASGNPHEYNTVLTVLVWVGGLGLGFFVGGLVGALIDASFGPRLQARTVRRTQQTPQAGPATPPPPQQ